MSREYSKMAVKQLKEIEQEVKKRPPGDEKAQATWLIERTRELICTMDARIDDGLPITKNIDRIDEMLKILSK